MNSQCQSCPSATAAAAKARFCDLTLSTPEENLACDEALLDKCDAAPEPGAVLRFWEPDRPFVVVGYANHVEAEVNLSFCRGHSIPVLRRCSGGGTVLQASGCLNYSLILPIGQFPELQGIHTTNEFILHENAAALSRLTGQKVQKMGDTDLAISGLKVAGNAQRRKRQALLFHGCILLNLDLDLLEQALPMPSKQPNYRADRAHREFVLNLGVEPPAVKAALRRAWGASETLDELPWPRIAQLTEEKYKRPDWNFKF